MAPVKNLAMRQICNAVRSERRHWLVTGSAGFIGSHLLEALLRLGQRVTSLDNFATGHQQNLDEVKANVGPDAWANHRFIEGDISELQTCREACDGVDVVLHQAALGSVPRSIEDPLLVHASNVTGFLTMLVAARESAVGRFVYAASSSTYGDSTTLPKVEHIIGRPLSPYAVTKYADELYAGVFAQCYGMQSIGLRYFNVFGARQDPQSAYAAVIPAWANALLAGEPCVINGDGETSRDFCFVENVVQMNLRAALSGSDAAVNQVFNVAVGEQTTLNQLYLCIRENLQALRPGLKMVPPEHRPERPGDIRHSLADISKATSLLQYSPTKTAKEGLRKAMAWYVGNYEKRAGIARAAA